MYPKIIKELAGYLSEPLCVTTFEESCGSEEVPDNWRIANVVPGLKRWVRRSRKEDLAK